MSAPTCGLEGCASDAIVRYRIRPRSTRSLFDAAPYWKFACHGHINNVKALGQVLEVIPVSTGEPQWIVWRDEEGKT